MTTSATHSPPKQLVPLLRNSLDTLLSDKVILFPFCIVAFIQLFILEILYFSNRYPLNIFFAPIIKRMRGEIFLHYPYNFELLREMFNRAQVPIDILINNLFFGIAIYMIAAINNDRRINFRIAFRATAGKYVHILAAALISFGVFWGLNHLYAITILRRALAIHSKAGIFFIIKQTVLLASPYVLLLIGIFVTALFAFVLPLIVIEGKKFWTAIALNFKYLWRSFWFLFWLVMVPTLFYVPLLILSNSSRFISLENVPGANLILLVLNVFFVVFINAMIYTSITVYYLLKKESR